jgi:hypothetical protein
MVQPRQIRQWCNIKAVYWLFLPVVNFGIWIVTGWINDWVLSHSYDFTDRLQTNLYPKTQLSRTLTVVAIDAKVDRNNDITDVTIKTTNSSLERIEFKFPLTEPTHLEITLANKLDTTPQLIRTLTRYQFD